MTADYFGLPPVLVQRVTGRVLRAACYGLRVTGRVLRAERSAATLRFARKQVVNKRGMRE